MPASHVPWRSFIITTIETLVAFYSASFSLIMYFLHRGTHALPLSIIMVLLYVFVLILCVKRTIQRLPLPALMLIVPIAPLIALILIVSLIPLIEKLL